LRNAAVMNCKQIVPSQWNPTSITVSQPTIATVD
jgi:hypothetical protein